MKQASELKKSKQTKIDLMASPPINHKKNNNRQNSNENEKCKKLMKCEKLCVSSTCFKLTLPNTKK